MSDMEVVHLDPAVIKASRDDNSRYGLLASGVEKMKASILDRGGVQEPVSVELLRPTENGFTYRLLKGFYRHAAVTELNKDGAGLTVPAIVRAAVTENKERLLTQLAENTARESQSPMDIAVAIKKLLDEGTDKVTIRKLFARPGGKKSELKPASNAWVNIMLGYLELPKSIQEKIHDGQIGVAAAYELGKSSPEKRAAIVERAEAARAADIEREEKDEEKYLKAQAKAEAETAKAAAKAKELDDARAAETAAVELIKKRTKELREVQKEKVTELPAAERKVAMERLRGAENSLKAAEGERKKTSAKLAKVLGDHRKQEAEAAEAQTEARKAKPVKGQQKAIAPKDIQKAAKAEGDTRFVPLKGAEMLDAIKEMVKCKYPKVAKVGVVILDCFQGKTTPKEMIEAFAKASGELK
jgi:hypothetical protein